MINAPLYPQAWNVWLVAVAGQEQSSDVQGFRNDTIAFLSRWIGATVPGASDFVLLDNITTPTFARREQLDKIPMLPPGPYTLAAVRFWYDGSQRAVIWPADTSAMVTEVHQPDTAIPPPKSALDKLAAVVKPIGDTAKTVAIGLVVGAALILLAVYVSKRPVTVRYLPAGDG